MDALEARAVLALRDITRRDRHAEARDRAAHESGAEPSPSAIEGQADGATKEDLSLITRRSPHSQAAPWPPHSAWSRCCRA